MTIHINQIAVDFTLENERTLADLTSALRTWAHEQDLAILGILADGQALGADDPTPLDQIHQIDVEAVPVGERDLARVAVVAKFFALVAHAATHNDGPLLSELRQEYASVRGALFPLLSVVESRLRSALEVLDAPWTDTGQVQKAASRLAVESEGRRLELQAPKQALLKTVQALVDSAKVATEVGALFQQGRDHDGFERILALFNHWEDLARRTSAAGVDEIPRWQKFHRELQPFLQETEGALSSGDYVLLSDLLEYEILPRLFGLPDLFPEVSNLDPAESVL